MKLVWSPENALKAYVDTVKSCEINEGSGVAELISAMAAGWNAKLIVETWSYGGAIHTSIGLAIAATHTGGRHVCIVPDTNSRSAYTTAIAAAMTTTTEILVGEPEEVMRGLEGVDFLVVDCGQWDFTRVFGLVRLSEGGAIVMGKNVGRGKTMSCRGMWRGAVSGGGEKTIVRTVYLPVGNGLDMAHVVGSCSGSGSERWVRQLDHGLVEEDVTTT